MSTIGKILMTLAIATYTFIPPLVELTTTTHVFHEGWLPHARMHTVWLLGVTSGIGLLALYLLWKPNTPIKQSAGQAGTLSCIVYLAFFISAGTTGMYGGALSDVNGGVEKGPMGIDANVFTFGLATLTLLAGWALALKK